MLYFITISLIILNLLFYKIHFLKTAVLILSLVFLFILNGWSSGGNDITNTMLRYDNTTKYVSYTEFLYNFITVTANDLGLSYRQFSILLSAIETFLLYRFIAKNSDYPNLTLAAFMIYPMAFLFTTQRFTMAFILFLYGGIDPLLNKRKLNKVRFLVFWFISFLIHYSMIFYILFLLVDMIDTKLVGIFTSISFLIFLTTTSFSITTNFFSRFIDSEKLDLVLLHQQGYGFLGRVILILLVFSQYFTFYMINREQIMNDAKFVSLHKYNMCILLAIPLTITISAAYVRVPIANLPVNYSFYFNILGRNNSQRDSRSNHLLSLVFVLFTILCCFYLVYRNEEMRDLSLKPLFEENELIQ